MLGYYYSKKEQEEMVRKGYSIKLCSDLTERDRMAHQFKLDGYRVQKAYTTTQVRGLYDYYLWIKYIDKHDKELKKKLNKVLNKVDADTKKDYYVKILKESKNRVMPYINKIIKINGLTLNEPVLDVLYNKGGKLGSCRGKYLVTVSDRLLDSEIKDDIDSVMAHEILHCVKEAKGHDKIFKSLMKQFNEIAPFKIYQFSNETIKGNDSLMSGFKYTAKCEQCNKVHLFASRTNWRVSYYKKDGVKCDCGGNIRLEVK